MELHGIEKLEVRTFNAKLAWLTWRDWTGIGLIVGLLLGLFVASSFNRHPHANEIGMGITIVSTWGFGMLSHCIGALMGWRTARGKVVVVHHEAVSLVSGEEVWSCKVSERALRRALKTAIRKKKRDQASADALLEAAGIERVRGAGELALVAPNVKEVQGD